METQQASIIWRNSGWSRPLVVERDTDSALDTLVTLLTPSGQLRRITSVDVHYSNVVTLDVTISLKSGAGAAWDTVRGKITLTGAQDLHWIPDGDCFLSDDDALEVLAPAGGAGITGGVSVYSEVF